MSTRRSKLFSVSAPLGVSGTHTETHDLSASSRLLGAVIASHAGTLHVDHSVDGVNWIAGPARSVAADTLVGIDEPVYGSFVRVRFLNGLTAQTSFQFFGYEAP